MQRKAEAGSKWKLKIKWKNKCCSPYNGHGSKIGYIPIFIPILSLQWVGLYAKRQRCSHNWNTSSTLHSCRLSRQNMFQTCPPARLKAEKWHPGSMLKLSLRSLSVSVWGCARLEASWVALGLSWQRSRSLLCTAKSALISSKWLKYIAMRTKQYKTFKRLPSTLCFQHFHMTFQGFVEPCLEPSSYKNWQAANGWLLSVSSKWSSHAWNKPAQMTNCRLKRRTGSSHDTLLLDFLAFTPGLRHGFWSHTTETVLVIWEKQSISTTRCFVFSRPTFQHGLDPAIAAGSW